MRISAVSVWLSKYGVASARTVLALVDKRRKAALLWGVAGAMSYLAPDVYVFSTGQSLPRLSYVVMITLIVVLGSAGIANTRRRVKKISRRA